MMTRTFSLFATALVGASLFAGVAHAQVQAGSAGGVNGQAMIVKADYAPAQRKIGAQLGSGEPIYMGDQITTGDKSGMQVMLLDQTILTLGQNARMTIDDLVYDPKTGDGKLNMKVAQGAFRYVSGKIALNNPQNVSIGLPVGTIGIRGTIVGGNVTQESSTIALLGPGSGRDGNEKVGAINVSNPQGSVDITRAGYATTILPGQAPSLPQRLTLEQMIQLRQAGAKAPSDAKSQDSSSASAANTGASAAQASGESQAAGATTATQTQTFQAAYKSNSDVLTNASQQSSIASASANAQLFWAIAYGFSNYPQTSVYAGFTYQDAYYLYDLTASATADGSAYSAVSITGTEKYLYAGSQYSYTDTYTHVGGTNTSYYNDGTLALTGWTGGSMVSFYSSGGSSSSYPYTLSGNNGVPVLVGTFMPLSSLPTSGTAYFALNTATPVYGFGAGGTGTVTSVSGIANFTNHTFQLGVHFTVPSDGIYAISSGSMTLTGAGTFSTSSGTVSTTGSCSSCTASFAGGFSSATTVGATYAVGNSSTKGFTGGVILKPGGAP